MGTPLRWQCCNCGFDNPYYTPCCCGCPHYRCPDCYIYYSSPTETTSPSATTSQWGTTSPSILVSLSGSSPPWHASTGTTPGAIGAHVNGAGKSASVDPGARMPYTRTRSMGPYSSPSLQNSGGMEKATERRLGRSMVEEEPKRTSREEAPSRAESDDTDLLAERYGLLERVASIFPEFSMFVYGCWLALVWIATQLVWKALCLCWGGLRQVMQLIWKAPIKKARQQAGKRIWEAIQEGWQLILTATQNQPEEQSSPPTQSRLEPQRQQGPSDGKRRRERADSVDGLGQERPLQGPSKKVKRPKEQRKSLLFACPFWKKDSQQYPDCISHELTGVRYVKQHLKRAHCHEIDQPRKDRLQMRSARVSKEKQWYNVFEILFPGSPLPDSPYKDRTFTTRELRPLLGESLLEKARARGMNMGDSDIQEVVDSALSRLEEMPQHVNNQVSNSDSSDDSSVANEASSSTNAQSNPTHDMQTSQQGSAGWEELPRDSSLFLGERPQDQQLGGPNLDRQPELSDELFEWLNYFDADGLAATEFDQPLRESSEAKA